MIQVFVKYIIPKKKLICFLVMPLNIQWCLCYNFIHVYFIKISNEKLGLNTILTNQFQTYLFLTFIIPKFLRFCSWFTISPIEGLIVSKWNLSKIWIYLCFCEKYLFFKLDIFSSTFFCILYHALTNWRHFQSTSLWNMLIFENLKNTKLYVIMRLELSK